MANANDEAPPIGRPPELTPKCSEAICLSLSTGATREAASYAAGIHPATMRRWMARGRKEKRQPDSPYARFHAAVLKAESEAEVRFTALVYKAAPRDWRAAAWWLERRRNTEFGKRLTTEISGPGGKPIQSETREKLDLSALSTEELLLIRQLQTKAKRKKGGGEG